MNTTRSSFAVKIFDMNSTINSLEFLLNYEISMLTLEQKIIWFISSQKNLAGFRFIVEIWESCQKIWLSKYR